MLTPAPAVYQSFPDLIAVNNPSIASDNTWSSTIEQEQRYNRSIPKARPSKLSRPSLNHRRHHHHHHRPSKQFVATTSSAIFGDWDIELKISHRTLAKTKGIGGRAILINGRGTSPRVNSLGGSGGNAASASTSGGRGGGGDSIVISSGPGAHTGSSGTQPLSAFPSSTPAAPASSLSADSALKMHKGELLSIDFDQNNKPTVNISTSPRKIEQSQSTNKTSALTTTNTPTTTSRKQKKQVDETVEDIPRNSLSSPTVRSSFLKALGKFKSKHLQQKRSSAPPSSLPSLDIPESTVDRRASYIIPPMQFNQQGSDDLLPRVPSPTATALEPEKVVSISITSPTEGSIQPTSSFVHEELVHDGTSSLRVKFKNKVNTTLASMKSSSNLRDKFKTQSQDSQESSTTTITPRHRSPMTTERPLSTIVTSSTSNTANHQRQHDYTESNGKNRNSKTFWTFPRIRPETNQSSKPQISWGPDSDIPAVKLTQDTDMPLSEPEPVDDGTSTLHKQLEELKVEEPDSDNSLDIILPVDYEDYTQFAELPLKKRKKMERSLAAASESTRQGLNKRPSSIRLSTGAMKKFLKHESAKSKGEGEDDLNGVSNIQSREINPINVNKKRPQLSTESDNSSRRSGLQTAEWRRSFMKTLHLGKAQSNTSKIDNPESNVKSPTLVTTTITTATETPNLEELPVTEVITTRFSRSNTVRSRSLSNATHPALLAAAIAKPRSPGLRRETLEMAMRRRRQSSVARSNISDTEAPPLPFSSEFFNGENVSTTNITHTFTSFTLELAEMFAHDVVNNSSVPGLFNFKRRAPRLTVSSNVMELDTDQEFKAFDSDAISGYTGDADMSMEEASAGSPKWPATPRRDSDLFKTRVREASFAVTSPGRRKMSSIDGDSDTVPELPTLTIRTRDLNRSSGGRLSGGYSRNSRPISGSSFDLENDQILNGPESPRSPRRAGGSSPMTLRKSTRSIIQGSTSPTSASNPSSPTKMTHRPMSIEEITSWKPKSASPQQLRPQVPTLDTKPLKLSRGNGASATTTLILPSSSRTPYAQITQSPALMSPGSDEDEAFLTRHYHHQSTSSSSSSRYPQHLHQISGDTLVPSHLRYTSTTSNMSAGSGYSAQTLSGYHPRQGSSSSNMAHLYNMTEAQEFDPSQDFSPTTPADLKAMDFEALLATAEQEQQKGWEDLMAYKKTTNSAARPPTATVSSRATTTQKLSSPQRQQQSHQPDVPPLKIASSKNNRSNQQYQQRGSLVFDLGPSDDGTGTGTGTGTGSDRSMRSKRVMKKKMSVIRLAGNVQGRREDDGVIRVSLSPTPYSSSNIAPSENVPNKW